MYKDHVSFERFYSFKKELAPRDIGDRIGIVFYPQASSNSAILRARGFRSCREQVPILQCVRGFSFTPTR